MIKFFRHIRQRMIKENRFSKYILYAIGEIVLVVTGILIALQLNNWNTEKSIQKDTKDFTIRLLSEVRENLSICEAEILVEQEQINCGVGLLQMFNTKRSELKSRDLDSLVYILLSKNTIDLNLSTLTEGLNTAKVSAIGSDSLRTLLYALPSTIEKVTTSEEINGDDIDNFFTPYLYKHLNWRKMDRAFAEHKELVGTTGFPEHNSLECLDEMLFENLVDNRLYNSSKHLEYLENLKSHLVKLKLLLKS